jgi:hypothetical protein
VILLAVALTLIACAAALSDLRKGLLMVLVIGAVQDPFRKLTPGAPTYYILWSMAVFGVLVARAWSRGRVAPLRTLSLYSGSLKALWAALVFVVLAEFAQSFARWGPVVPVLGVIEWVMPLCAVLFGAGLAATPDGLGFFFKWYSLIVTPVALTIYLSPRFADTFAGLRDIGSFTGTELIIYAQDTAFGSFSGLFRTGEIAAWHAATAAVFLIVLAQGSRSKLRWGLTLIVVALLVGAIFLTGRRKMLMALTIFAALQAMASVTMRSRLGQKWVGLSVIGLAAAFVPGFLADTEYVYIGRGMSVFSSLEERTGTAFDLARSAYGRAGVFGLGIGVFSQASRYAGVELSDVVGGAGEAGVGKIILELGIPGLILLMVITFRTSTLAWRVMLRMRRARDPALALVTPLAAYVMGQIATFTVATQVYGDPFVLIVLGLTTGCLFHVLLSAIRRQAQANALRRGASMGVRPEPSEAAIAAVRVGAGTTSPEGGRPRWRPAGS